jgi:hypothetical protein
MFASSGSKRKKAPPIAERGSLAHDSYERGRRPSSPAAIMEAAIPGGDSPQIPLNRLSMTSIPAQATQNQL